MARSMVIPCKDCITYALCKQKNPLSCKLLYNYLYDGWETLTHRGHNRRMNQIKKIFKRGGYTYSTVNGEEMKIQWL